MASARVQRSVQNALFSIIAQALTIVLNFITRVRFVGILGIASNGLNGLFNEVVAVLSLAELGIGSAITYSLYKPLAEGDTAKISQIMGLFRTAYRAVAGVILAAGLCLSPLICAMTADTGFSPEYIQRIFLLYVLRSASTYLMSYKTSLLIADQRAYVTTAIGFISQVLSTLACLLVLYLYQSFEGYLLVTIAFNLLSNLCVTLYAKNRYPYIHRADRLPKAERRRILSNVRHVFVESISGKITNSTDSILITLLVGTISTGVYSNYAMVINSVKSLLERAMASVTGSLGDLMVSSSAQHCEETMRRLFFLFFSLGLVLGGGFFSAVQPFIALFFGQENLLGAGVLFVCACVLFLSVWKLPLWHGIVVSGLFREDKWTSIAGSVVNLAVSLVLGRWMGMAGIFLGTVCTYVIQVFCKLFLLYRRQFHMSPAGCMWETAKRFAVAALVIAAEGLVCGRIRCGSLPVTVLARGAASLALSMAVLFCLYGRSTQWKYFLQLAGRFLRIGGRRR